MIVLVRRLIPLVIAAVSSLVLGACQSHSEMSFGRATLAIRTSTGDVVVHVEVADSEAERERGLMGRRRLAADAGMAFVFDQPTDIGFWMKDTLIPLDVAYWTSGGRIVAIRHMRPCRADPCPLYSPGTTYVGALEANWGFLHQKGVHIGDRVRFIRSSS